MGTRLGKPVVAQLTYERGTPIDHSATPGSIDSDQIGLEVIHTDQLYTHAHFISRFLPLGFSMFSLD